jgi:N6-adenosine-specific RNA methylase IME4
MKSHIITDLTKIEPASVGVILADPPWEWLPYSNKGKGRSAEAHYDLLSAGLIGDLPIYRYLKSNAVLFLWIHNSMLPDGLATMDHWGFIYKSRGFTWLKTTKDGSRLRMGMGKWTRYSSELCLLGTRGKPKPKSHSVCEAFESVNGTIAAPVREHSRKPDEIYPLIEELCEGPYLELFASSESKPRKNWTYWVGKERSPVRRWSSNSYPDSQLF